MRYKCFTAGPDNSVVEDVTKVHIEVRGKFARGQEFHQGAVDPHVRFENALAKAARGSSSSSLGWADPNLNITGEPADRYAIRR